MKTEKAYNGRFLGALGFLGFLGFLAFTGTSYSEWTRFAWLSVPSLVSLGVFIPFDKAKVKVPVNPRRRGYLGVLGFLGCLGFLGSANPDMAGLAGLAAMALLAGMSTQPDGRIDRAMQPKGELSGNTL
jgi:hypothetical protein